MSHITSNPGDPQDSTNLPPELIAQAEAAAASHQAELAAPPASKQEHVKPERSHALSLSKGNTYAYVFGINFLVQVSELKAL